MKKVSVIVPVYNSKSTIRKCVDSIINGSLSDIELILVDDGSTDNSLSILNEYKEKYENVKVLTGENNSAGGARNRGLDVATGEYIMFVDSDDYIEKDTLEVLYKDCEENGVSIARCGLKAMIGRFSLGNVSMADENKNEGIVINPIEEKDYVFKELPSPCNKLVKRELYRGLRYPEKTKWEDVAMTRPLLARSEGILYRTVPKYNYRLHPLNTTITDFIIASPRVLDIFKSSDCMEENFKNIGLYDEFSDFIKTDQIFQSLLRVQNAGLWISLSHSKKTELLNALVNLIEIKYGEWQNNTSYIGYKKKDAFFRTTMDYIEKEFLRDSLRRETCEENGYEKVKSILKKR